MADVTTAPARELVETSMLDFVEEHPDLRYVFFGGKGGVGKTVLAGVAAVAMARRGRKTLLASTNPVHSLSGLLDQDVFGEHTSVEGVDNLWALEIDTKDAIQRAQEDIKEKISWFLKFAEIKTEADEFIEAATLNPAFEESAMFENMIDLIFADEYEVYVFDTAPTANARRLLGMSKVYDLWVNKMIKSRQGAQSMRASLSITKKKEEEDPLMDYLIEFRERVAHAKALLTDPDKTAFFFVTLPEALPIAVIRRFIDWFTDFGIPVGGVVVNQLITQDVLTDDTPEFVLNRMQMQAEYLDVISDEFDGLVRGVLPQYEEDLRGVGMLRTAAEALFEGGEPLIGGEDVPAG